MQANYTATSTPVRQRLAGWCRRRANRSRRAIWVRIDAAEFVEWTGVSLRSVRYALARLREDGGEFAWRTVFDRTIGRKGAWTVLCALRSRLQYDREPLHRDREGRTRHLRESLRGKAIIPPVSPGSECNPYYRRDTSYLSREETRPQGAGNRVVAPVGDGKQRLLRFASGVARRLEREHWDTCRVRWQFAPARALCFDAARDGWTESEIRRIYGIALLRAHSIAVDCRKWSFNLASTLTEARAIIARDQRTRRERVIEFYRAQRDRHQKVIASLPSGTLPKTVQTLQ